MDVAANPVVQLIAIESQNSEEKLEKSHSGTIQAQVSGIDDAEINADREHNSANDPIDFEDNFPEGGLRAWLVVLGAFLTLFPSFGLMVSIGTLQDYWHTQQLAAYSSRDVGWIPSVFVYLSLGLGIWIGPLFDRYGPRWIIILGSAAYIAMMFLLAECKLYWQFMLCMGVLGGIAGAALTTTSLAVVAHWFKVRRGLVQGIAMGGNSFGGVCIPLVLRAALPRYGYTWAIRILAFVFATCLILSNFLLRARLPPNSGRKGGIVSFHIFLDLRFSLLTLAVFGFEIVLFGTLGILPTYASLSTEYPADTGFYLISVMNGVSCFGRVIPGFLADRYGRFNILLISIVGTLILMLVVWLPFGASSLPALYVFVALFGFGTGCWMALTPACVGQLCRADEFGRYFGTMYFLASLATLVCVPITGELVEVVGGQAMVGFLCAVLSMSMCAFVCSRWACLGWSWSWTEKV